ncbi:MAG TPA: hypothetical protein VFT06_00250 [Flavisolibacter sp.]|nr:hypothetical protein [Flavisolibacter sp.]
MATKLVKGKDVIIYQVDGTDKPVICAKSCTITKSWEVLETTNRTSGRGREFRNRRYEWDFSLNGIVSLDLDGTKKGIFDFFDGAEKDIKAVFTDGTNTKTLTGTVIPPNISLTGDVAAFSSYSLTLKGTGDLTIA